MPNAFPLMAIAPYQGRFFGPSGQGTASCLGPMSIGTATNAYVTIYATEPALAAHRTMRCFGVVFQTPIPSVTTVRFRRVHTT